MTGTADARISTVTPLASAISQACPISEKPVTSVAAWASRPSSASAAYLLRQIMESVATLTPASSKSCALKAVVRTPVPSAFVSTSASPACAPALASMRSSSTKPVTARPNLGSWSLMEWPPATMTPASRHLSAPPARICPATSSPRQLGKHSRFKASAGRPPMAQTSERAFAAATWPNRKGSSTIGGKKSVVPTRPRPSPRS